MSEPPEAIQVGPWRVRVTVDRAAHDAAQVAQSATLFGHFSPEALEITLAPGLPRDQVADTLLHEVIHALTDQCGLTTQGAVLHDNDEAETVVAPLATALLDLLRRNPALVRYLTEEP